MAHDRASLDGGDARQESQHATLLGTSLGLERVRQWHRHISEKLL